jgi:hypothetical protein
MQLHDGLKEMLKSCDQNKIQSQSNSPMPLTVELRYMNPTQPRCTFQVSCNLAPEILREGTLEGGQVSFSNMMTWMWPLIVGSASKSPAEQESPIPALGQILHPIFLVQCPYHLTNCLPSLESHASGGCCSHASGGCEMNEPVLGQQRSARRLASSQMPPESVVSLHSNKPSSLSYPYV